MSTIRKGNVPETQNKEVKTEKFTVQQDKQVIGGVERSFLQSILGTTALVSAALFYISWLYHRRYFEAFGLHANMISYEARDYILNAKSALAVNAVIIAAVILSRFIVNFQSKKSRLTIALFSIIGFVAGIIYLISDVLLWSKAFGINIVGYRSAWVLIVFILALLLYSAIAPTFIHNRLEGSKRYKRLADSVTWSSLLVVGFLAISLSSNFIGYFEGKHDASITSRLPVVTVSTKYPIGVDIQPDFLTQDMEGNEIYFYYNLRLLAREGGTIYVLRPESNVVSPLVYMVDDVASLTLGQSTPPFTSTLGTPAP